MVYKIKFKYESKLMNNMVTSQHGSLFGYPVVEEGGCLLLQLVSIAIQEFEMGGGGGGGGCSLADQTLTLSGESLVRYSATDCSD